MQKNQNELYHTGRRGMRWYQHIFGQSKSNSKSHNKSHSNSQDMSKMTNEELRNAIARKQLLAEYNRINKPAERKSRGRQIAKYTFDRMILPAATDIGKQIFTSMMAKMANDKLKLNSEYKVYANNKRK